MYLFLLTLLVLDGLFLGVVILLQAGKGGGLAAMGGGAAAEGLLGGRQATSVLTRATWIGGGIFMALSLVLSILSARTATPTSVIRDEAAPAVAPAPVLPEAPAAPVEVLPPSEGAAGDPEGGDSTP